MAAQTWFEYLLEFLNVLVGFDYKLDQVHEESAQVPGFRFSAGYPHLFRAGLRRFVFYGTGGRDTSDLTRDGVALDKLQKALVEKIQSSGGGSRESALESLESVRELLRSFRVVEYDRSWFAKSLFPAHEAFLAFECYRRKDVGVAADDALDTLPLSDFDKGFDTPHNFFCRGGELYYLLLSSGTRLRPDCSTFIEARFRQLLQSNSTLGTAALLIENTWNDLTGVSTSAGKAASEPAAWLPSGNAEVGPAFAEELQCLLRNDIDSMELLVLTGYLVAFQVIRYIYHCTSKLGTSKTPFFFIDCLGYGRIRELSARSYKLNDTAVYRAPRLLTGHEVSEVPFSNYLRHQYPIHRSLGKRIGLIAPINGINPRYVISDEVLRALVLTVVPPGTETTYDDFLDKLWTKYRIALGPKEASKVGLPEFDQLNRKLLDTNQAALRERLKNNGLLEVYSDAVAIVRNRFPEVTIQ